MSADLALQKALRARLVGTPEVVALVPPHAIIDRSTSPVPRPSIVLGLSSEGAPGGLARAWQAVVHDVHIFVREPGREGAKRIIAAVRKGLRNSRMTLDPGWHLVDLAITSTRTFSEPDRETSHGIVTVEALIQEVPL